MALPYLIKHIYNTGTDEVIRRGKKIFSNHGVELAGHDELMQSVNFRVKDDSYNSFYKVSVQKYDDPALMALKCGCPYNMGEICRHETAALMQLQDLLDRNILHTGTEVVYDQRHTIVKMKFIDLKTIRMLSGLENYAAAESILRKSACIIQSAANEKVMATLETEGELFQIFLQKNDTRYFDSGCNCQDSRHSICKHKTALFLQLLNKYGAHYFDSIKNWDGQKNKLLQSYGYSLDDDLTGKFEFLYKEGKPYLKVLDTSIKKVAPVHPLPSPKPVPHQTTREETAEVMVADRTPGKEIALLIRPTEKAYPYLEFSIIKGQMDEESWTFNGNISVLDLSRYIPTDYLKSSSKQLIQHTRKLLPAEINKYLDKNSPFSGFWENIIQKEKEEFPEETRLLIAEYLHPKLKKTLEQRDDVPVFYLDRGKRISSKNLEYVEISETTPSLVFTIENTGDEKILSTVIKLEHETVLPSENQLPGNLLFLHDRVLYLWAKYKDALVADKFKSPLHISNEEWPAMLKELIIPLAEDYTVNFDRSLVREVKADNPQISIHLIEKGDFLLFQPLFSYHNFSVKGEDKKILLVPEKDKVWRVKRNTEAEESFFARLQNLHSQFVRQPQMNALALKGQEVLKNNWFFLFVDAMKEQKIPVFGFDALRNFRFNTAKPSTRIQLSSGMDWFDAKVELVFGSQQIGIEEIQKALSNKQSFVQLGDGTLGILPEEWMKKYALLFKMGEGKQNQLRLSKFHTQIIDDLYQQRDEIELQFDLDEKFDRLREFKNIPEIDPPAEVNGRLRPYQLSGFHWLNYLHSVGWGGILADDMGLGKTVQALSMLSHYKKENDSLSALVVCPTTLIYNWENEIKKFTPSLTFVIHHGSARTRSVEELKRPDIIITTYGTLRSDIQLLLKMQFDYAILDESQAIKNPFSKVTKAASLLRASHKICMSGTPLQNNTFDLYAQMNFLNPELLGSVEFFRNEFSTPIDKLGDSEQKEHLRKLLFPFILRRTKEQVARDLPEKTETILYCEMESAQRRIYEAYRNAYREQIIGVIDQQGVGRSQLTILQGLMKLRQICDSPAILNEEDKFDNHSIKLEELTRELTENIGEHKALVFSQFLGMLALIREQLEKNNIEYEYFDGSTPPAQREIAIRSFQNNESCRVFLISLKAGGVGLNLTAADYVYIVDPWWNPAVEQQAIDRTHRIGQTKNIFAYRMICKDTIEDKILNLQERKRILARELISDDQSFVKNLTREDVEYLFS